MLLKIEDILTKYRDMLWLYYELMETAEADLHDLAKHEEDFTKNADETTVLDIELCGIEKGLEMEPEEIKKERETVGRKILGPNYIYYPELH